MKHSSFTWQNFICLLHFKTYFDQFVFFFPLFSPDWNVALFSLLHGYVTRTQIDHGTHREASRCILVIKSSLTRYERGSIACTYVREASCVRARVGWWLVTAIFFQPRGIFTFPDDVGQRMTFYANGLTA